MADKSWNRKQNEAFIDRFTFATRYGSSNMCRVMRLQNCSTLAWAMYHFILQKILAVLRALSAMTLVDIIVHHKEMFYSSYGEGARL